jgi:hypothetical protein
MKANEAPEKIYRTTFYLDDDKGDTKWKKAPVAGAENIEYVRTDAFIEKACEWLDSHMVGWKKDFIENFRNYMGE